MEAFVTELHLFPEPIDRFLELFVTQMHFSPKGLE